LKKAKKPSPTTIVCFKIKVVSALCKATDTLCLKRTCKIDRGGPLEPFVDHTMSTAH